MRLFSSQSCRPSHILLVTMTCFAIFGHAEGGSNNTSLPNQNRSPVAMTPASVAPIVTPVTVPSEPVIADKIPVAGDSKADSNPVSTASTSVPKPQITDTVKSNTTNPTKSRANDQNQTTNGTEITSVSNPPEFKDTNPNTTTPSNIDKKDTKCLVKLNNNDWTLSFIGITNTSTKLGQLRLNDSNTNVSKYTYRKGNFTITLNVKVTIEPSPPSATTVTSQDTISTTDSVGNALSTKKTPKAGATTDKKPQKPVVLKNKRTFSKTFVFLILTIIVLTVFYCAYKKCSGWESWEHFKIQCAITKSNIRDWWAHRRLTSVFRGRNPNAARARRSGNGLLNSDCEQYELL